MWVDSLPQVGNIYDVTNPGLTTIAYLRHVARSTRPPPIIHPTATMDAEQSPTAVLQINALPATMQASVSDASYSYKRRAERAVPRRGTIMVSPTQAVPEVLAVWGCRYKKDSVS